MTTAILGGIMEKRAFMWVLLEKALDIDEEQYEKKSRK